MTDYIPLFVAIVAALPGLIALRGQLKKDNADANASVAKIQEEIEERLWERVRDELKKAQDEINALRLRVSALETENAMLREENVALRLAIGESE